MRHWDWHAEGFSSEPFEWVADFGERVFRVWGGEAGKKGNPSRPGVCFSLQRPASRLAAERLFSVWEWGNACVWVTEFVVAPGTRMHVAGVSPGSNVHPEILDHRGVQVFIENPIGRKVAELSTELLNDDLGPSWISPRSGKA